MSGITYITVKNEYSNIYRKPAVLCQKKLFEIKWFYDKIIKFLTMFGAQ